MIILSLSPDVAVAAAPRGAVVGSIPASRFQVSSLASHRQHGGI
jgi:hypothetical protein